MPATSTQPDSTQTSSPHPHSPEPSAPQTSPPGVGLTQNQPRQRAKERSAKGRPTHQAQTVQRRAKHRSPIQNRVSVLLVHIPRLSIQGQARLAVEVGVSRSTISRLARGRINPSYRLARGVTDVLERMLGRPLDMREVFSTDGTYLTPSGCALCRCHGCLPDRAWNEDGCLKPGWKDARPGDWSLAPETPGEIGPTTENDRSLPRRPGCFTD